MRLSPMNWDVVTSASSDIVCCASWLREGLRPLSLTSNPGTSSSWTTNMLHTNDRTYFQMERVKSEKLRHRRADRSSGGRCRCCSRSCSLPDRSSESNFSRVSPENTQTQWLFRRGTNKNYKNQTVLHTNIFSDLVEDTGQIWKMFKIRKI